MYEDISLCNKQINQPADNPLCVFDELLLLLFAVLRRGERSFTAAAN